MIEEMSKWGEETNPPWRIPVYRYPTVREGNATPRSVVGLCTDSLLGGRGGSVKGGGGNLLEEKPDDTTASQVTNVNVDSRRSS